MRKIIWTNEAESDYLLKEWTISEAEELLHHLKTGKIKYKASKIEGIRESVVCKQITLFYCINENNNVELLKFWNNYQDEIRLKL